MGMMGGAALGLGAGVLGGALIADAVNDHDQEIYQDGYSKFDPNDPFHFMEMSTVLLVR